MVGPNQIWLVSLLKGRNLDTDMYTCRMPGEDEGSNQGDASISQGMPKISSKPPESSREAWNRFSFTALRRDQATSTTWTWTSNLQNYEKVNSGVKPPSLWYFVTAALAN